MLKKEEKIIIKNFYETKYPKSTHELGLDCCFDYYNAICFKLLRKKYALKEQIEPIPQEIKEKIEQYIKVNKNNDYSLELRNYYKLLNSIIKILEKNKI